MLVKSNYKSIDIEPIHNYYEDLVFEALQHSDSANEMDEEEYSDIACIALNNLPAKYIRYEVDLLSYSNANEREIMREQARRAVQKATRVVKLNSR